MKINCETILNDPNGNGVFYAGQIVSGVIEINVNEIFTVKGISVSIKGEAFCKWSERNQKTSTSDHIVYKGKEIYLNSKTYLVQKSDNGVDIDLPPGKHVFHFKCKLPQTLPPSIDAGLGFVRYQIIVIIERPSKSDLKYPVQFNVLIPLNLNNIDEITRQPKYIEKHFKFFSFSGTTCPLLLRVTIPRTAYAIGEVILINIEADNLSPAYTKYLCFSLIQNIMYHSVTPSRNSRLVKNRKVKQKSRVVPKLKRVNFDQHIAVPYLPVTDDSCNVICVSYDLEIKVVGKRWHNNKKMLIPIIIGNVPVRVPVHDVPLINKMI